MGYSGDFSEDLEMPTCGDCRFISCVMYSSDKEWLCLHDPLALDEKFVIKVAPSGRACHFFETKEGGE